MQSLRREDQEGLKSLLRKKHKKKFCHSVGGRGGQHTITFSKSCIRRPYPAYRRAVEKAEKHSTLKCTHPESAS
eukprot:2746369-Rhodomonas_salina.1